MGETKYYCGFCGEQLVETKRVQEILMGIRFWPDDGKPAYTVTYICPKRIKSFWGFLGHDKVKKFE